MEKTSILDTIEPDLIETLAERKQEIERGAGARPGVVAMLALGSVPIALAALSRDVYGQGTAPTASVKAVLDFAFALEVFEDEFYKAVLGVSANAAANAAFAPVRAQAITVPGAVATLKQIEKHEAAHRATLLGAGATNVFNLNENSFDFTGARGAGNGPFAGATTNLPFLLAVAQGAEDTGVRAYKGQAGNLMSDSGRLEAALRIHSVEARHASRVRRMRRIAGGADAQVRYSGTVRGGGATAAGPSGLPTLPAAVVAAFNAIYGAGANATTAPSEANVTQGGVDVTTLSGASFGLEAAQEAFDEPLDRADVVAIVQGFFIPTIQ